MKDLVLSLATFCEVFKVENIKQILDSPLWYNSNLSRGVASI